MVKQKIIERCECGVEKKLQTLKTGPDLWIAITLVLTGMLNVVSAKAVNPWSIPSQPSTSDPAQGWSGWSRYQDGQTPSSPAAAVYNNQLYTMVRGMDNGVYVKVGLGSGWAKVDGTTLTNPSLTNYNGQLYSFICRNNYYLLLNTYDGNWRSWNVVKGSEKSSNVGDTIQFRKDLFLVFRSGSRLFYRIMNSNGEWDRWGKINRGSNSNPALAVFQETFMLSNTWNR